MRKLEHSALEANALALGRIGRVLDERIEPPRHAAGRERVLAQTTRRWRSAPRRRWWLLAAALSLPILLVCLLLRRPARLEYRVTGPSLMNGAWLEAAPAGAPLGLHFSDGTELGLAPGSKGRVAEVTSDGARIVLSAGHLQARVVHRSHTHWLVAAGPYEIEVTGTAFDVDWSDENARLELTLHDGSVMVRGPSLSDGLRVAAGQRLILRANTGEARLSSTLAPPSDDGAPAAPSATADQAALTSASPISSDSAPGPAEPSLSAHVGARPPPTWSELLAAGNFRAVRDAAEARGVDAVLRHGSLPELVALADSARYLHERGLAQRGLLAERARFASSAEARGAAFVLGRMADDSGARADAIHWYDTYLAESPRGAFAAEALGRKLVALVETGSLTQAHAAAAEYLQRFPHGPHAAYARDHAAP